jgi:two-component system phosphate regulon sensor histidine kinase PhoR
MTWIKRKFSRKLGIALFLAVGTTLALADFFILKNIKTYLIGELKDNLVSQAKQISAVLDPGTFTKRDPRWQELIRKMDQSSGTRVTIVRKDGVVLYDSEVDWKALETLENHADRPEVTDALRFGEGSSIRYSHTLRSDLQYAAIPYPLMQDAEGTIRLAIPLNRLNNEMKGFANILFAATFTALLIGIGLIWIILRWSAHPLEEMTRAAESIANGRMDLKVRERSEDEIGQLAKAFNAMTRKLSSTFDQLKNDKNEIEAVLSSMVEHVIAVDASGKVIFINPAAEKLFGIRGDNVRGRPFMEAVRQAAVSEILKSVMGDDTERFEEIRLILPEERFFEARAVPMQGVRSERRYLLVLHDVTRIRKLEQVRREFVSNVSHELKTPLTSIQGYAETLLAGALADSKHNRDFVDTIFKEADRLNRLVNDLLDLASIESGRKKPQITEFELAAVVNEVHGMARSRTEKTGVRIENRVPPAFLIQADKDQMKQLLLNLIDNAVKFNLPNGSVAVESSESPEAVTFSIKDTGIGIPEKDLPRIFERFYRIDKSHSREIEGTGLGLAIVKHIVEAHGGSIRAESVPGSGSNFTITLPKNHSSI